MKMLELEDILADREVSDSLLEVPLSDRVFHLFLLLAAIIAAVIIVFLFKLSVLDHQFYVLRAGQNISGVKIQQAPRGIITDRFGAPLARSEPTFSVYLVPHDMPYDAEARRDVVLRFSEVLGVSESEALEKLQQRDWNYSDRVLISNSPSHDAVVALTTLELPGVQLEPGFRRVHEEPLVYSHVLGYTGLVNRDDIKNDSSLYIDDEIGRSGLELYYEEFLRGEHGRELVVRDSEGRIEESRVLQEPKEGGVLSTYIDKDFQDYAYNRLHGALETLERDVGAFIAMNPQNGEIISLFSIPGFDTSKVSEYLERKDQPLFNRVIAGLYNPGSVIKPLHALAALVEKVILPETKISSPGYIEIANPYFPSQASRFVDWRSNGSTNIVDAIARSSNVYFYEVGGGYSLQRGIGISGLNKWWKVFQLDQRTGIDMPSEASGFLPTPEWKEKEQGQPWRVGDTYNVSIGQGDLLVTPLSIIRYVSAIANGGRILKPRISKNVMPEVVGHLGDDAVSMIQYVRRGMEEAVSDNLGTAHLLSSLPVTTAGKTGSAQVDNNRKVNAFFVGYAPTDNPQIAILILIENAREGSLNVVPVAYDVLRWYYENRLVR